MGNMSINSGITDAFVSLVKVETAVASAPVAESVIASTAVAAYVDNVATTAVDETAQNILSQGWDMVAHQSIGDVVAKNMIAPLVGDSYISHVSVGVSSAVVGALAFTDFKEIPKALDAFQRRNWKQFALHSGVVALASVRIVHEFWYGQIPLPKLRIEF